MRRLAVLAKRTAEGQVKTRLSPALPPALAAGLHAAMLEDTLAAGGAARADTRTLLLTGPGSDPGVPSTWSVAEQASGDLGTRLAAVFASLFDRDGVHAVAIGADCPDLDPARIDSAFAALETHDLVLGPAADGGYWLIGLARPAPELFSGIAWSTPAVLDETHARARTLGLKTAELDVLADIDMPADLARWIGEAACSGARGAPATRRALAAMGLLPEP